MRTPLDPKLIPKYKNQLPIPPVYAPKIVRNPATGQVISHNYKITMSEFMQQLLPKDFPKTKVWGYGGFVVDSTNCQNTIKFANAPGATFHATRGIPINVQWINNITGNHLLPVDPTLHWADPNNLGMVMPDSVPPFPPGLPEAQSPVPVVPHLHGGEDHSIFDGHPDAWFTADEEIVGSEFVTTLYHYPNKQLPTTLWYHDHGLGITRLNVLMGLAGFYLIKDPKDPLDSQSSVLPSKEYEIPMVIQDRSFNTNGSFNFPTVGDNPEVHPYWMPEFFGDTIMVNGSVWPNLNVKRRQYRFRLLNGSNARFYNLEFSNKMSFLQIGSDGGYLAKAVKLTSLLLAPAERADILVDFSCMTNGSELILTNSANAPFPTGNQPESLTTGQIMKFTVTGTCSIIPKKLPIWLNKIPKLLVNSKIRTLVLYEVEGANGPLEVLLDGQKWSAPISELPIVGSTEKWQIVNLTMDTHPIHLHLVQFLLSNRQSFKTTDYLGDWIALNNGEPPLDHPTEVLPVNDYLEGSPIPPDPNESGWKDTIRANPNEVTSIIVRFAPQDSKNQSAVPGVNLYPFNPTTGPGYVWHCHILDHEDNEMMRPFKVIE